jgi:transcriptional regulator with XRE-family HTH domain
MLYSCGNFYWLSLMDQKNRVDNLRKLIAEYGSQAKLADAVGCTPSVISQLMTGHREVGEKLARKIESGAGRPPLWLDKPQGTSGSDMKDDNASSDNQSFIQKYRKISDEDREMLDVLMDTMAARNAKK